jgi:hypothetical protein
MGAVPVTLMRLGGTMTSADNPSVVLVHGAYADGSSWSEVIRRLLGAGITATAVQNPLTSLADDVEAGCRRPPSRSTQATSR